MIIIREFTTLTFIRQQHRLDSWGVTLVQKYPDTQAKLNITNHSHIPQVLSLLRFH